MHSATHKQHRAMTEFCLVLCAVLAALSLVNCGGNGTAAPQAVSTAELQQPQAATYPVPVYVPMLPQPPGTAQLPVQSWNSPQQPVYAPIGQAAQGQQPQPYPGQQPYAAAQQGVQPYYPTTQQPQYPQYQTQPGTQQDSNPWAMQAHRSAQDNSWANSQPWGGGNPQQANAAARFRPLQGETQGTETTPPPVAPYDQVYGSSQRPLPRQPYYGGYAGAYPGGYAGAYPGTYPGAWGGGWPGGYHGGYPGYGATPYAGMPGMGWPGGFGWPGMW